MLLTALCTVQEQQWWNLGQSFQHSWGKGAGRGDLSTSLIGVQ